MRNSYLVAAAVALTVSAGCASSAVKGHPVPEAAATSGSSSAAVRIVAIGDSDATGAGDSTGRGWVGRYGELVKRSVNAPVTVDNLAVEGQTTGQLRSHLTSDGSLRQALHTADVVLIGMGGADLNAGDDALDAGRCTGRQCYAPVLRMFAVNINAIATEVRHLAPTAVLRGMGMPNGFPGAGSAFPPFATADLSLYQARAVSSAICVAMRSNGGRCVDVLSAFNGTNASGNAYALGLMTKDPCCYPSSKGQQLMARLLLATGLAGLHTSRQALSTPSALS